ncbi:hypothetical protein [Actinomadura monticuli]|uniref:Uncharacterized protein n=1 Tax=Actinomadura monticuli TaxID=3097367 RepID=A0ABV4QCL4_9ACTN
MYAWIWRRLPGAWPAKTAAAAGIVIAVAAVLWYALFPQLEAKIQFDHGVVQTPAPSATPGG